jgi:hypothetical protein
LVKLRTSLVVTEEMLQQLDFEKGSKWVYDPHGVIAVRRPMYKILPNPVVEINANMDSWENVKKILEEEAQNQTTTESMDQSNVIQTPQKQELQLGKMTFLDMHSEMDIDDHLSESLRKKTKGDEELDLEGFLADFTGEGKGIFQIRQGSSEASSSSKGPCYHY